MEFEVPDEMLTRGRPLIPAFDDDESLYRRVPPERFFNLVNGALPLYSIWLPDASVNREYPNGEPEFVLFDTERGINRNDFGILAFKCKDVPLQEGAISSETLAIHTNIEHDPLKKNYYHAEIRVRSKNGERLTSIPDPFDQEFRIRIRSKLRVIRDPS